MKGKSILIIGVAVVVGVAAVAGVAGTVKNAGSPVEVTQVSYLNSNWWDYSMSSGGYITANASQQVYLDSDTIVEKVYVKEGDQVKIGDTLLDYDKTLLELELEEEKLNGQIMELELKGAENDLAKLKTITPVADSEGSSHSHVPFDDYDEPDDDDDDDLGAASVIPKQLIMVTAALGEGADTGVQTIDGGQETDSTDSTENGSGEEGGEGTTEAPQQPSTEAPQQPSTGETEEPEESPLGKTKAYKKLNYKTKYYKGSGTKKDPYIYLCSDGAVIEASFMNMLLGFNSDASSRKNGGVNKDGKGVYAVLEIREGDSLAGGFLKSVTVNGTIDTEKPYAPDITWTFTSLGVTKNVPDIPDEEPGGDDDFMGDDMWDFGDDVYTASELKEAIAEKEKEIKEIKLDLRDSEISIKQAQRKVEAATVKATINGVVKEVGDPKVGQVDGEPFMTVTSNKGMYVKGTISEMDLGTITVGSVVSGTTQESGMPISAEITEISQYPSNQGGYYYGGESNPNASSYPFIAYVEDSDELINNEWVDLQIQGKVEQGTSIYLPKALIRSENGQSYVYKADENKKLVKQYVRTGKTMYSSYIEVKEGLNDEDWIAFPYGKNVKEGASVKELEGSGFMDQMYY